MVALVSCRRARLDLLRHASVASSEKESDLLFKAIPLVARSETVLKNVGSTRKRWSLPNYREQMTKVGSRIYDNW